MNIVFQTTAFNLAFTALILAFTANNIDAFGETEFKETEVLSSRTLTKEKSPYLFNHDVLVRPEGELIVEPGVELRFAPEAGITVRGVFNAEGTPEEKIKFVSYEPIGKSFFDEASMYKYRSIFSDMWFCLEKEPLYFIVKVRRI